MRAQLLLFNTVSFQQCWGNEPPFSCKSTQSKNATRKKEKKTGRGRSIISALTGAGRPIPHSLQWQHKTVVSSCTTIDLRTWRAETMAVEVFSLSFGSSVNHVGGWECGVEQACSRLSQSPNEEKKTNKEIQKFSMSK